MFPKKLWPHEFVVDVAVNPDRVRETNAFGITAPVEFDRTSTKREFVVCGVSVIFETTDAPGAIVIGCSEHDDVMS